MIVHFDLDAFYASVEQRDDPSVRGKPVAIAWNSRRGVVLTASYEARPYGVRSAMPLYAALERCPELVVRSPDFERYRASSRAVFAIFGDGARAIEGLSLDEAFADLETSILEEALEYARNVRRRVSEEVGLTVSAGVSAQKMLAKIASDDAKPDGLKAIEAGNEAAYLAPLGVGRLWGIGPKTRPRLEAAGVNTIGDLAQLDDTAVYRLLGRFGMGLRELARGNDTRTVSSDHSAQSHSISSEETFEYDLPDGPELRAQLRTLTDDVVRRMEKHGLRASTVGVKVKRSDFSVVGRQTQLAAASCDARALFNAAAVCLDRVSLGTGRVRLLGVRVASLVENAAEQLSLLVDEAAAGPES